MLMIECKNKDILWPEFHFMQVWLLLHKYLYYVDGESIIEDSHYDAAERYCYTLAKNLGFRSDKGIGPEDNERHHVHWMVGFNEQSPYWEETKEKYKSLLRGKL